MKRFILIILMLYLTAVAHAEAPDASEDAISYLDAPPQKERGKWLGFEARIAADMPIMRFEAEWSDSLFWESGDGFEEINVYTMWIYLGLNFAVSSLDLYVADASIWIEEGDTPRGDIAGPSISLEDINGDGFLDLRVLFRVTPSNLYYHFYLWNPELQRFEWLTDEDGEPFTFCNYTVYPEDKMITNYFNDENTWGVCWLYLWEDGKLRLLRSSYWDDEQDAKAEENRLVLRVYDFPQSLLGEEEDNLCPHDQKRVLSEQAAPPMEATMERWVDAIFEGLKPAGARIYE